MGNVNHWASNPWGGASVDDGIKREVQEYIEEAEALARGYQVEDDVDYEWVVHYIKEDYEDTFDTLDCMNAKARNLQWYIGGLVALVVGILVFAYQGNVPLHVVVLLTPFLLLSLASTVLVLRVLSPVTTSRPPKVPDAVEFAEYHGDASEFLFALQYVRSTAYNRKVGCANGITLRRAYVLFYGGLATLAAAWIVKLVMAVVAYYVQ